MERRIDAACRTDRQARTPLAARAGRNEKADGEATGRLTGGPAFAGRPIGAEETKKNKARQGNLTALFHFCDCLRARQAKKDVIVCLPLCSKAAAQWKIPCRSSLRPLIYALGHAIPHLWDGGCYQNRYIILLHTLLK